MAAAAAAAAASAVAFSWRLKKKEKKEKKRKTSDVSSPLEIQLIRITHQLLTWRIVSPVSCANCFFCSSEG